MPRNVIVLPRTLGRQARQRQRSIDIGTGAAEGLLNVSKTLLALDLRRKQDKNDRLNKLLIAGQLLGGVGNLPPESRNEIANSLGIESGLPTSKDGGVAFPVDVKSKLEQLTALRKAQILQTGGPAANTLLGLTQPTPDAETLRQKRLDRESRESIAKTGANARINAAGIQASTRLEAARIQAEARKDATQRDLDRISREKIANIQSSSRISAAEIRSGLSDEVINQKKLDRDSREKIATIQKEATIEAAKIRAARANTNELNAQAPSGMKLVDGKLVEAAPGEPSLSVRKFNALADTRQKQLQIETLGLERDKAILDLKDTVDKSADLLQNLKSIFSASAKNIDDGTKVDLAAQVLSKLMINQLEQGKSNPLLLEPADTRGLFTKGVNAVFGGFSGSLYNKAFIKASQSPDVLQAEDQFNKQKDAEAARRGEAEAGNVIFNTQLDTAIRSAITKAKDLQLTPAQIESQLLLELQRVDPTADPVQVREGIRKLLGQEARNVGALQ